MNLHFAIADLTNAIEALLQAEPELAHDEVLRADMLAGETNLEGVLDALVDAVQTAEARAEAASRQLDQLDARGKRYDRAAKRMRGLIEDIMDRADIKKMVRPAATLTRSWRKPSPLVIDEYKLPDDCCRIIRKADMAAIKAKIEAGETPDGVTMNNGKHVLTIRS